MTKFAVLLILVFLVACSVSKTTTDFGGYEVKFSRSVILSAKGKHANNFGGISGIDYIAEDNKYLLISDDRSEKDKARAYEIALDENLSIESLDVTYLKDRLGRDFLPKQVDPESIRYYSKNSVFWSTELSEEGPAAFISDFDAGLTKSFTLPEHIYPHQNGSAGARSNKFIEGITFSIDKKYVIFSLEAPLIQDGRVPSYTEGGRIRLLVFEASSQELVAEYFYTLDAIPERATAEPYLSDNGVSEILMIDTKNLLVLERSGWHIGGGEFDFDNRVYSVQIPLIDNSERREPLGRDPINLEKTLFMRVGDFIGQQQGNLEGFTLGPNYGERQSLLIISDNNFSSRQDTQLLEFLLKK
ncbi:esterase-like activity of phytase family protein [Porticoccus sp. W117]|uniref:esterase-like activity of phytase family protein n=1 Tax=Porticoccus sp. W117 TaxID=3054777 RepID=UPI00259249BE|nr:esterase-like activity of phytase family protein [Porticoccus sp. W117]MDM3872622.1 esterase-like activity of phytase family protein [Porticoccus sp. W117]